MVIPAEDDVQRASEVLAVKEPGEGTLKTSVSPVLKKPVELDKIATNVSLEDAPTV